jgi:serine/threonine protein kinase
MPTDDTITLTRHRSGQPPADLQVPRELDSVRLLRQIGAGAMGVVWLGHDRRLDRDVAVKFLLKTDHAAGDTAFSHLIDGARAAAKVRHPALNIVHHADRHADVPYLVMDFIDGPTLRDVVRRRGRLDAPYVRDIMGAVGEGVGALHDRGIVHRDLKTANVLVERNGQVFVTDFGLACVETPTPLPPDRIVGTPAYMSPEMFDGVVSLKTDVYALGVMTYELFTGNLPFRGETVAAVRTSHRDQPLPVAPLEDARVAADVREVIARATHKNPVFRYKSAGLFTRALLDAIERGGTAKTRAVDLSMLSAIDDATASDDAGPAGATLLAPTADGAGSSASRSDSTTPPPDADAVSLTPKGRAEGDDDSEGSSYFQRLSQLASQRKPSPPPRMAPMSPLEARAQGISPARRPDAAPPDPAASTAAHQSPPRDERDAPQRDLPCVQCHYNLRGMDRAGRCPECGAAVADSVFAGRLVFSDAGWLRSVMFGLALLNFTVIAEFVLLGGLVAYAGVSAATAVPASQSAQSTPTGMLTYMIAAVIGLMVTVALVVSIVLATAREPADTRDPAIDRLSVVIRTTTGLTLAAVAAVVFLPETWTYAARVLLLGSFGATLAALPAYFGRLARRIPDAKLAAACRRRAVALGALVVIGVALSPTGVYGMRVTREMGLSMIIVLWTIKVAGPIGAAILAIATVRAAHRLRKSLAPIAEVGSA